LIEDTYYSDTAAIDAEALRQRVLEYAKRSGIQVREVLRQEHGVLPLPEVLPATPVASGPWLAGYAAGLFHPTTGYSLPVAVRLASCLAQSEPAQAQGDYGAFCQRQRGQARYCTLLNRLLFRAFAPDERYHVLEHFYRLPEPTIRRFYALELSPADRARILCGRPPDGFSLRRWLAGGNLA